MNTRDQLKILDAGFIIIRADESNLRIKAKTLARPEWHTYEKGFKSKAELRRRIKQLRDKWSIVED